MGFFKKNAANMITMIRIPCAFGIIFTTPFTPLFYVLDFLMLLMEWSLEKLVVIAH